MSEQEKREKAMRIFEALSSVEPELLGRAEEPERLVWLPRVTKVLAACVCVAVVGVTAWIESGVRKSTEYTNMDTAVEKANQMSAADKAVPQEVAESVGVFPKENAADTEGEVFPEENAGDTEEEVFPEKDAEDTEGVAFPEKNAEDTEGEVFPKEDDRGATEKAEIAVGEAQTAEETVVYMSEEELRAVEGLGVYVPKRIPEGYTFENGFRVYGTQEERLRLCWVKGMDSIVLSVSNKGAARECLADISRPETYNVQLYEIPYAETVPEEWRQVFEHPVFRAEDFTEEVVAARMKSYEDSGDTATPGGHFGVLYDEGVEVLFNGKCTVEEVWEMFESIG